jgi:hypothetical protein
LLYRNLQKDWLQLAVKPRTIAFRVNVPALDLFPTDLWATVTTKQWRRASTSMLLGGEPKSEQRMSSKTRGGRSSLLLTFSSSQSCYRNRAEARLAEIAKKDAGNHLANSRARGEC